MVWRIACYVAGLITCAIGVTFFFYTYFPPEVYGLPAKEFSQKYDAPIGRIKTIYDCCSGLVSVVLSLCFFGSFVGVNWGSIVCSIVNGWLIGRISPFPDTDFTFKDVLSLRQKVQ